MGKALKRGNFIPSDSNMQVKLPERRGMFVAVDTPKRAHKHNAEKKKQPHVYGKRKPIELAVKC